MNKARQVEFDLMHPCIENVQDYVNSGLVQPWDTSLLPSYKNLNPALTERGMVNGQQYFARRVMKPTNHAPVTAENPGSVATTGWLTAVSSPCGPCSCKVMTC